MFFLYQLLIFITLIFSPIILFVRFLKNKEDKKRFIEKFSIIFKKENKRNLVWFHAASVGEVMSIGRNFEESIQKAIRMVTDYSHGFDDNKFNESATNIIIKPGKNANHQAICR